MDNAAFRSTFVEFADETKFTDQLIDFWASVGESTISADVFGGVYEKVLYLYVAHNLVLSSSAASSLSSGGGQVASKSVGDVSISYDTSSSVELDAGHWNQTAYGRQYIRLVSLFGAGCRQL